MFAIYDQGFCMKQLPDPEFYHYGRNKEMCGKKREGIHNDGGGNPG